MTKPPAKRGQGRKPLLPGERAVVGSLRLTAAQWAQFQALGGPVWLRSVLSGQTPGRMTVAKKLATKALEKKLSKYLETEFCVHAPAPFTLRIGVYSPEILALHERHQTTCSSFVSACNPLGFDIGVKANAKLHEELLDGQIAQGFSIIEGVGRHPSGNWSEASCLILGLPDTYALKLAKRFQQHAVVCIGEDAVPKLVMAQDHCLSKHEISDILKQHVIVLERSIRQEVTPESTVQTMVRRQRLYDAIDASQGIDKTI